ncbi:cbb3-type cytochrome oxidase assembly protein CcoS [Pseudomonas sp. J452]|uniref:cbb3-type cytochrome oxidase assembly protein CcoS n=1 Tax=Pseudomonas sp. J452 TaxID=2898441 RepID=UPI0021ADCBEF|nr:cbb3-type cytochrome oxidase assembly protein CcoS [Pseudomonas sp. J452]UUY07242.1 cbb3-type cytochrome oxidase assembly protein CcoS [Pseudomonas sp. J452]
MSAIYILIPIAVGLVGFAIWLFVWAVDNGQYDDLDGPAHSILFDDEDPQHQAGIAEADKPTEQDEPRA